jgi:hypothetical protein
MSLLVGPRVDKEIPRRPLLAPGRRPSVAPRGLRVVVTPRVRGHRPMRPTIALPAGHDKRFRQAR